MADILTTDGDDVYLRNRKLEFSKPVEGIERTPIRLVVPSGYLDAEWFHRIQWSLDTLDGNLIAFDKRSTYGSHNSNHSFFIPDRGNSELHHRQ